MGAAVVTRAIGNLIEKGYHVGGVAVLDVVEGSAIEALPYMQQLLESRPEGFSSQEQAVEWQCVLVYGSSIVGLINISCQCYGPLWLHNPEYLFCSSLYPIIGSAFDC
jgi:hypothetical protein